MKKELKGITNALKSRQFWINLFISIISIFAFALNYNIFLVANNLVTGGTGGIAIIVNHYFGIEPSTFIFIFNAIFIIICLFLMGVKFTFRACIGAILYPLAIYLTKDLGGIISNHLMLQDSTIIAVLSGLISGVSTGLIFKTGYSTSGNDILVQMVNRYFKIPSGSVSFVINLAIVIVGGITFGLSSVIYSTIIIAISSLMIDKIIIGISDSKMFYINTQKPEEIKDFITSFHTGYTVMKAEGAKTKEKDIIMCVINTRDYYIVKESISLIDPNAFIVISDCYEVCGGTRKQNFPFL